MAELKKQLNLLHVFCIASGAMISSGIFILPGLAHAKAGPAVIISYFFAGLLATAGILNIAELVTAMPKTGGDYFYISRGLGPAVGTIAGLLSWFSLSLKSAFALIGLAVIIAPVTPLTWHPIAAVLAVIFTLINIKGTKEAAGFQVVLVIVLVALMLLFITGGFFHLQPGRLKPFIPHGTKAVFATAGFVFVSYGGLIKVAGIAGEVKQPGRTIPRGMLLSVLAMITLYTLMIIVTSGVLPSDQLDNSLTPIADAASQFWHTPGYVIVTTAAALAFIATANAGILTASRYLLALSKDNLLPSAVIKINPKTETPTAAILITGLIILIAVFVNLQILVEAASTVFVLGYAIGAVAVIIFRQSGLQNYRPVFLAPLYPWLQLITILGLVFILFEMGEHAYLITALMILIGFAVYWFYGRPRTEKESALLHLIEKITPAELVAGTLEDELKDIVRERDRITVDKFDHLVQHAPVIDLDKSITLEEFFTEAARQLAPKTEMTAQTLKDRLLDRERETSTVIGKSLAIPHVVIEGENRFVMALARCREGIHFSQQACRITTVFILIGTNDQRNLYLRVLAALAHIAQQPSFQKKWLTAKNPQALKDLISLSDRRRIK